MAGEVEREMTITHAEFWRTLNIAFADEILGINGDRAELRSNGGRVLLRLSQQASRRMGALNLPVTTVRLVFEGMDEAGRQAFLKRFERSFQRGGG